MRLRMLPLVFAAVVLPTSGPDPSDVLRIQEAYRLTTAIQDSVWPGGWGSTPFPLLLVAADREYLFAFPRTPQEFTVTAPSAAFPAGLPERPRQFQPGLLATFPAFGPPSVIVLGRPEATNKTSTTWVLTILHERFHQVQNADAGYFSEVEKLDLSGGDQTGMWMLNYPFPYGAPGVADTFALLSRRLGKLVEGSSRETRQEFWRTYERFLSQLSERDRRYLSFQIWQEGVARYVELRAADVAARVYEPTHAFKALPDFTPFANAAGQLRSRLLEDLRNPDLPRYQRVSFYSFGAALALALDQDVPGWQDRYLREKFAIERYLHPAD